MNKPVVLRIPAELVEAIEAQAKATGQSMNDVLLEALDEFYGHPLALTPSAILEQVQQLQQQLNKLQHQMEIILSELKPQAFRLTNSEQQSVSSYSKRVQRLEAAEKN